MCWGDNHLGQLGDGTRTTKSFPARVRGVERARALVARGDTTCAIVEGGGVSCWGALDFERAVDPDRGLGVATEARPVTALQGVRALASSPGRLCALDAAGKVRCVKGGRALDVPFETKVTRVASDGALVCAARDVDAGVRCVAFEESGALTPIPDFGVRAPDALALFGVRVCGLADGAVSCAQPVTVHADHIRKPEPPPLMPGRVVALAPTGHVSFDTGAVVRLEFDEAVIGFTVAKNPVWTALARGADRVVFGARHACASTGERVRCFGDNVFGQLGQGTRGAVADAVDVDHLDAPVPSPPSPANAALAKLRRDRIKPKQIVHAWANARIFEAPQIASLRGRLVDADDASRLDPDYRRFGFVVEATEGDFVRVASDPDAVQRCGLSAGPLTELHAWLHKDDLAPVLAKPATKQDDVLSLKLDLAPGAPLEPNDRGGFDAVLFGSVFPLPDSTAYAFSAPRKKPPRDAEPFLADVDVGRGPEPRAGFATLRANGEPNLLEVQSACAKGTIRTFFIREPPEAPAPPEAPGWLPAGTPLVLESGAPFGKLSLPVETGPSRPVADRTCFDRLVGTLTLCTQPTPTDPDKPKHPKPKKKRKR